MTADALTASSIFAIAALLFISNRFRGDLIGIFVILALSLSGVLTAEEALAGFSNPVLIILICMFVVSEAVSNTGVAQRLGKLVVDAGGKSESRLIILLMIAAGFVGSFMNSTATVGVFIPVALSVCRTANLNQKRMLIPVSFAALISGMMTLVASTQNLISNQLMISSGYDALDFFSFTPFGLCVLAAAITYILLFGRKILGKKTSADRDTQTLRVYDLIGKYGLQDNVRRFEILPDSSLIGQSATQARLRHDYGVDLIAVEKGTARRRRFIKACPDSPFVLGDVLLLVGDAQALEKVIEKKKLKICPRLGEGVRQAMLQEIGVAEILIGPDSMLIGQTLQSARFGSRYHVNVLSARRRGTTEPSPVGDRKLHFGDALLVCGGWDDILNLVRERVNFVLLTMPQESCEILPARRKAPVALGIIIAMALSMGLELLPTVIIAMLTVLSLMLTGCVDIKTMYRKISWQTAVLVGGMLPMATALSKSGASLMIADMWTGMVIGWSPYAILAGLFFLTTSIGWFLPSAATAVLVVPIAVKAAADLGMSPHALVMTATIACACPFVSPFSSPANLLAMEAGGYTPKDFVKAGVPMLLLATTITVLLASVLYL